MRGRTLGTLVGRDLRRHGWRLAALALLVAIVVATIAGRNRARATILLTQDATLERLGAADLEILCAPGHVETLREAAAAADVAEAEVRRLAHGVLRVDGRRPLPCIVRVLPEEGPARMHRLALLEGRLPRPGEAAAVIDRALGPLLGVHVGDTVEVIVARETMRLPVVGISLSCEFPVAPIHPEYVLPLRGTLAAISISASAARDHRHAHRATSILLRLKPGQSPVVVRDRIADAGVSVTRCTPAQRQAGPRFIRRLIANFDVFTPAVVGGLAAAGAAMAFLLLGRLVRRERGRVGILEVQGFRPTSIALSFVGLAVPTALAGAALGYALHASVARSLVRGTTANLGFLPVEDSGPNLDVLWTGAGCLGVLLAAVLVPAFVLTRLPVARVLRPGGFELSRTPAGALLRGAAFLRRLVRVPPAVALGVNHALRRRRETVGAAIGLGFAFALLFAYLTVHLAHRREIPEAVRHWSRDATVHLDEPAPDAVLAELAAAAAGQAEPFLTRGVFLLRNGEPVARRSIGLRPQGIAAELPLASGRHFTEPDASEAIVDQFMALRDGIHVGDQLELLPFLSSPEATTVSVVGIADGISFGRVLLPLETARGMYALPGMSSGAHIVSALPADELERRLWDVDRVESVFGTRRLVHDVDAILAGRLHVIRLGIFTVVIYAVIFLAIVASLDASDRAPQIALLTSMGWRGRALFGMLAGEVVTRGVIGLLLGLVGTPLLAGWFARQIAEVNGYHLATPVPWPIVGAICLCALGAFLLAALPAWWMARRQPVSQMVGHLSRE